MTASIKSGSRYPLIHSTLRDVDNTNNVALAAFLPKTRQTNLEANLTINSTTFTEITDLTQSINVAVPSQVYVLLVTEARINNFTAGSELALRVLLDPGSNVVTINRILPTSGLVGAKMNVTSTGLYGVLMPRTTYTIKAEGRLTATGSVYALQAGADDLSTTLITRVEHNLVRS